MIKHEWNGTILTITSDSGTSSCDLKGEKGDDGARGAQGKPGSSLAEDTAYLGGIAAAEYALKTDVEAAVANSGHATAAELAAALIALPKQAENLLDNSYFANPVNQRGFEQYLGNTYTIDRWRTNTADAIVNVNSGYVSIAKGELLQYLDINQEATYTAAIKKTDGTIVIASGTFAAGFGDSTLGIRCSVVDSYCRFLITTDIGIEWAALYEGSYSLDNLPVYIPKGYATELLECQRYYYAPGSSPAIAYAGYANTSSTARITIQTPVRMRIKPTLTIGTAANINVYDASGSHTATDIAIAEYTGNAIALLITTTGLTAWTNVSMRFNTNVSLSAEL